MDLPRFSFNPRSTDFSAQVKQLPSPLDALCMGRMGELAGERWGRREGKRKPRDIEVSGSYHYSKSSY